VCYLLVCVRESFVCVRYFFVRRELCVLGTGLWVRDVCVLGTVFWAREVCVLGTGLWERYVCGCYLTVCGREIILC